jgi:N-acyl-D-amino-acid deacylase
MDPVDAMIDLALSTNMRQLFIQPFANLDLEGVDEMLERSDTVLAISDTGAHVSQLVDSSIPTFLLAHWVVRENRFSWEEGIRMLTSEPADLFGFRDRGRLGWATQRTS